MTASNLRRAAEARRAAAERRGESGGDREFRAARHAVAGVGAARSVGMSTELRASVERRNGKDMVHTSGYFTRYNRTYPMWDEFGEYEEVILGGSGRASLAATPDVAFLVNHRGVTMARTRSGTLDLREDAQGGFHDAWLNPERQDVKDLVVAINDGDIDQMSYAFMIPENAGVWNEDFTVFSIAAYDIHRGDVSAVNFGANPYTDISARSGELLREMERLPVGARREAYDRLTRDTDVAVRPTMLESAFTRAAADFERKLDREVLSHAYPRESARISWRAAAPAVDPKAPAWERRLRAQHVSTADRLVAYAGYHNLSIHELPMVALPWFEIRNAVEAEDGETSTDVLIYDSIGGSFGVNAASFAEQIAEIDTNVINLRINSPGGSVFDAIAIHSSLLHHPARVHTFIDGLAASAASVVAMAGDRITMMPGSEMMIHKASMMIDGNDDDAARAMEHLRRQSENIAGMYAARAGGDVAEWMALMTAETWMLDREAVDMRLADDVYERPARAGDQDERMARKHDLRHFRYAGRAAAAAPRRRSGVGESETARPVVDMLNEMAEQALGRTTDDVEDTVTTPAVAGGRTIELIEAELKRDQRL